ncbi:cytochrome c biogenesis protein DipZ [Undibacterium sp.]|uniref:cytochrome c biogenesis protein DipZ n=1 Tax=Undibacterium sp. TaxID=1914977 RepID=UPI00374CCBFC
MIIALLAFLGGVLTILSPCILPVLPFVFARADQPFLKSSLPMLVGMAITFAGIATLAAVGGAWAVHVNQYGRIISLVLMAGFALTLLSRSLADRMMRPFVAMGSRLSSSPDGGDPQVSVLRSLLLGFATGLLWAPCAGPILGIVLTGAAISGPNTQTTLLLLAYAAGAATSLGVAIFAGNRLFTSMKKTFGAGEWIRRILGVAILLAVVAIAFGWDTQVLTQLSLNSTNKLEQSLVNAINPPAQDASMAMSGAGANSGTGSMAGQNSMMMSGQASHSLPVQGDFPALTSPGPWLNSPPLTRDGLRGKVVLVDFWTYSCINCLRTLPYLKAWNEKYKDHGLVIIGVHAPEFAFEKDVGNVRKAVADLGVTYPVVLDNGYDIWQAFNNRFWPAHYFIDANGKIRSHHFGEGDYDEAEKTIRELLTEAGVKDLPPDSKAVAGATGIQAAADEAHIQSQETYVGYERAANFVTSTKLVQDQAAPYAVPAALQLNQWGLEGKWLVDREKATLDSAPGKVVFKFYARDLHLVLGPGKDGKPVRFRVLLDGAAPAADHGVDTDEQGNGVVKEQRLYQLIRQSKAIGEHTFSIEFLDKDVQAFAFTFG